MTILWADISGTLWLLVFFRHDTYIYDPISIYLYNIQEVIYRCFTHIYSGTLWQYCGLTSVEHCDCWCFKIRHLHLRPYQYISIQHTGSNLQVFHTHLQWSDISGALWLLVFFRHDTYIYDPISVFLHNIYNVIYCCFTHIHSETSAQSGCFSIETPC